MLSVSLQDFPKEFATPDSGRKLKAFNKFENTSEAEAEAEAEALAATTLLIDSKPSKGLLKFLRTHCENESLAVADSKLGNAIKEKLQIDCVHNASVMELMRGVRSQLSELIAGLAAQDLNPMSLGLSHSMSRYKLKFSPDKGTAGILRKPNKDILEHVRKRQIEVKLLELEEMLRAVDDRYTDAEIKEKLLEARKNLEAADAAAAAGGPTVLIVGAKVSETQTHQIAARKEQQLANMRDALGIGANGQKLDGEDDTDERKRHEKKSRKNRQKGSSDDSEDDVKLAKKTRRSRKADSSDDSGVERKGKRSTRKQKRSRKHESDSSNSGSDSVSERKGKRSSRKQKRSRKHESDCSSSCSDSESDSDLELESDVRDRYRRKPSDENKKNRQHDSEDESYGGKERGKEIERKKRSTREPDSDEGDSDSHHDGRKQKKAIEASRRRVSDKDTKDDMKRKQSIDVSRRHDSDGDTEDEHRSDDTGRSDSEGERRQSRRGVHDKSIKKSKDIRGEGSNGNGSPDKEKRYSQAKEDNWERYGDTLKKSDSLHRGKHDVMDRYEERPKSRYSKLDAMARYGEKERTPYDVKERSRSHHLKHDVMDRSVYDEKDVSRTKRKVDDDDLQVGSFKEEEHGRLNERRRNERGREELDSRKVEGDKIISKSSEQRETKHKRDEGDASGQLEKRNTREKEDVERQLEIRNKRDEDMSSQGEKRNKRDEGKWNRREEEDLPRQLEKRNKRDEEGVSRQLEKRNMSSQREKGNKRDEKDAQEEFIQRQFEKWNKGEEKKLKKKLEKWLESEVEELRTERDRQRQLEKRNKRGEEDLLRNRFNEYLSGQLDKTHHRVDEDVSGHEEKRQKRDQSDDDSEDDRRARRRCHSDDDVEIVDTMIIQAIGLLDDIDKELNTYAMRVREWYGWHFPELAKIVQDNIVYAKAVKLMGDRLNAAKLDFSEILSDEVEAELKEASQISMGTEISDLDLFNIKDLCTQVLSFAEYRAQLYDYLKSRMNTIAPNLTALVGELVGARLIAHGGSLLNLAKQPGSTVQILGAEKALFRALKTKHATPKYGLIYHASLIGQAAPKHKGKISRSLAAKAALAIRYDALADSQENTMGLENRAKIAVLKVSSQISDLDLFNIDKENGQVHHESLLFQTYVASPSSSRIRPGGSSSGNSPPSKRRKPNQPPPSGPPNQNPPSSLDESVFRSQIRFKNYGERRIFQLRLEFVPESVDRGKADYNILSGETGTPKEDLLLFMGHFFVPYDKQDERLPYRDNSEYRKNKLIFESCPLFQEFKNLIPRRWLHKAGDMYAREWRLKGRRFGWDLATYTENFLKAVKVVIWDLHNAFVAVLDEWSKKRDGPLPSYTDITKGMKHLPMFRISDDGVKRRILNANFYFDDNFDVLEPSKLGLGGVMREENVCDTAGLNLFYDSDDN